MHIQIDRVFTTVARNLGLQDYSRYTNNWIEWSYEAEKLIGSRDTFVQQEVTYTSNGAQATGTITFSANPTSGDSIVLNGVTLYFRNSTDLGQAKSPNEIQIGDTLTDTMDNTTAQYGLIQSLKGGTGSGGTSGTYTDSAIYNYPEALNVADYRASTNLGGELVEDGDFSSATNWTFTDSADTTAALSGGAFVSTNSGGTDGFGSAAQAQTLVSGKTYRLTFAVTAITTSTFINVYNYSDSQSAVLSLVGTTAASVGTYTHDFISDGTGGIDVRTVLYDDGDSITIDNISLKEITNTELSITAKEIGPKGNYYSLESDNANAKVNSLSLTGGKGIYRNQQIVLPEDNIKLLGVRVGTDDTDHEHAELRETSAIHRRRVGKTTNDLQQRAFRYYVDGNRLNIQHDNLDEITVVYLKYPTDIRGWPMIKEGHETAVAQYIMWQMKLIEFYNGKLPQYITKELEKRWYFLCGKTRGDDGMPTSEELKQIGSMWNTLLPIISNNGLIDF